MFKCEVSGKISKPGEKQFKIVTLKREKVYHDALGYFQGRGIETAEELRVCEDVYLEFHWNKAP